MTKWLLGLAALALTAAAASAQGFIPSQAYGYGQGSGYGQGGYPNQYGPVAPPGGFLPNYYNRQTQPLSPYLNLARGGNPAVNYFYGVRPGTTQAMNMNVGPQIPFGYSQLRGGFIPTASNPEQEPVSVSADTRIPYIPSAAHPVVFGGGRPLTGGMGTPNRTGFAGTQMPPAASRRPPTR
jgi:hypothetical protein